MHDAIINPGCSGGPLCDQSGLILGINTAYQPEQRYSIAVTAQQAVNYFKGHVPGLGVKAAAEANMKDWREVVEVVRASTVQVLVFAKPDRFSPIIAAGSAGGEISQRQYDDRWCLACYGSGRLDCPERQCIKGSVMTYREDLVTLSNGFIAKKRTPLRVDCQTCNGRGVIHCDYCQGGFDPRFSR